MQVTVGGQYQGICDENTAKENLDKYQDAIVTATCIPCGGVQQLKSIADYCSRCGAQVWK